MVVRERLTLTHAGLVIGKQGSDIRALKQMPDVINIHFDTRSSSRVYTLQVTGVNKAACQAVYNEIQRRINAFSSRKIRTEKNAFSSVVPEVARTFIDVPDRSLDTIVLVPFGSNRNESVILGRRTSKLEKYIIYSFIRGSLSDAFDLSLNDASKVKPNFLVLEFMEKNISTSFQEALDNHQGASDEKLDFHMSPGKLIFTCAPSGSRNCHLLRNKLTGANGVDYMKQKGMRTFFTPNLDPKYIDLVNKKLAELHFEDLNEECPETYTTVHLEVFDGSKQTLFSVVLAVDENLESLKAASDDPRLSEDKKKAVKRILDAKTIGQVLEVTDPSEKVKMKYFKLTRIIHPDKNLHPGATEAFKKLSDAYEKLEKGNSINKEALVVENVENKAEDNLKELPPKVVKVKTKKIRMCVVTTLSAKKLDVRGSLVGYEEDKDKLSTHVRDALNLCWDQRDSYGKVPSTSDQRTIKILSIKQVLEAHTWAKEIPFNCGSEDTAVLEIKIKKLREKSGTDANWNDCVEIDLKLNSRRGKLTVALLAREVTELKNWVDHIFL